MDFYQKVAVPGGQAKAGCQLDTAPSAAVKFLPGKQEGADGMSLEWLSTFMEDCLSAVPSYTLTPQPHPPPTTITNISSSSNININNHQQTPIPSLMQPSDKSKAKKRKVFKEIHDMIPSDPPLLQQTHWLADCELIFPKASHGDKDVSPTFHAGGGGREEKIVVKDGNQQPRRCTHCLTQKTPQWRAGPEGPKTLCNACGMRFKSGSLFPEYRPVKSPTFVSYKHSNSTKKIMEMRKALLFIPFI